MNNSRVQRLNALIKKEINQIFLRDFEFPEEALVTITRVDTAPNLNQTKIYISVLPDEKITNVLDILDKTIYETQQKLNRRLKMRPVPRIVFKEEEKTSEAGRIEKILGELKNEGKD